MVAAAILCCSIFLRPVFVQSFALTSLHAASSRNIPLLNALESPEVTIAAEEEKISRTDISKNSTSSYWNILTQRITTCLAESDIKRDFGLVRFVFSVASSQSRTYISLT
jgi:hypothetical protein